MDVMKLHESKMSSASSVADSEMNWGMGRRCWILVLGDFGRSPRMQYHTDSLLKKGLLVTVIAFAESKPISSIATHHNCTFAAVPQVPQWMRALPLVLYYLLKPLLQFVQLLVMMFIVLPSPDFVLVQLPPAIPTLFICFLLKLIHRTRLYFDWHNLAFTLMHLNPHTPSFVITISRKIEKWLGRIATGNFCVSRAMQQKLRYWNIRAEVLYDRPHERYGHVSLEDTHRLMMKLRLELSVAMHPNDFLADLYQSLAEPSTVLTDKSKTVKWKRLRPAVLVSSTSWTPDEDFTILLDALAMYDKELDAERYDSEEYHPRLLVFITGRGPLRASYIAKMQKMDLNHVAIRTLWLEADDYPKLLGSADLGISLHMSSSGIDLPMKVLDMFGCALPVCSVDYPAITELVRPKSNGELFSTANDLFQCLWNLLTDFHETDKTTSIEKMKQYLLNNERLRWHENWERVVWSELRL